MTNWRVLIDRLGANVTLFAFVVWLLPGLEVTTTRPVLVLLVVSVAYVFLNEVLRPVLNTLFLPLLVQSYGLAFFAANLGVFAIVVIVAPGIEASSVWALTGGMALFAILHFGLVAIFGLTCPVIEYDEVRSGPRERRVGIAAVDEALRLGRVRQTIVDHGIDAAFSGLPVLEPVRRWYQSMLWQPDRPIVTLKPAARLRLLLQDLGPTYIKFGQLVSSRAQHMPSEWRLELEKLQSNGHPYPYEQIRDQIVSELGAPPEELYASFDPVPLATASLAQVHRAVTHEGRPVAVKIQKPGIRNRVQADVRILRRIASELQDRARWAKGSGLAGMIDEFGSTLLRELDYEIEAYNARRLTTVLENVEGVRVPEVIHELSAERVLTLEFVPGVKATDATALAHAGIDTETLATNMIRAAVQMLMIDGFFHADPHPGNVIVNTETHELTLLDTGMVGELSLSERARLIGLVFVIRDGDTRAMARLLKSMAKPFTATADQMYYREFDRRVRPHLEPAPGVKVQVAGKVLPEATNLLIEAGYQLDERFALAMKSLLQAEAITAALVPKWTGHDFAERAAQAALELIPESFSDEAMLGRLKRHGGRAAVEMLELIPESGEQSPFGAGFRGIEMDVALAQRTIDQLTRSVRHVLILVTMGLLLTGLVVGSAVVLASQGTSEGAANVVDVAGIVFRFGLIVGAVMASWLAAHLVRKDRQSG